MLSFNKAHSVDVQSLVLPGFCSSDVGSGASVAAGLVAVLVDTPDVNCHWYVTAPDNTFGEGFSWENAPWFSAEGLRDVGDLNNTMTTIQSQALAGN